MFAVCLTVENVYRSDRLITSVVIKERERPYTPWQQQEVRKARGLLVCLKGLFARAPIRQPADYTHYVCS